VRDVEGDARDCADNVAAGACCIGDDGGDGWSGLDADDVGGNGNGIAHDGSCSW